MDAAGNVAVARRRVHVVNPCGGEDEEEFPCLALDAAGGVCSAGGLCSSVTFEEATPQVVRSVPSLTLLGASEVNERWPLLLVASPQRALSVTQRALSVTQRALSVTPASSQRHPASSQRHPASS
jgi:hypothetical protein